MAIGNPYVTWGQNIPFACHDRGNIDNVDEVRKNDEIHLKIYLKWYGEQNGYENKEKAETIKIMLASESSVAIVTIKTEKTNHILPLHKHIKTIFFF